MQPWLPDARPPPQREHAAVEGHCDMLGPMWDVRVSLWPWLVLRDANERALFETTALRPGVLLRSSATV